MPIYRLEDNEELEDRGKVNLEFIGVRYTGPRSSITPTKLQSRAGWSGSAPLQQGEIQLALVPEWTDDDVEDRTVVAIENDPNYDVVYDASELAEALLRQNYLPPEVFGREFDPGLRDRVFDKLDIEEAGVDNDEEYRRQLREIAGVDDDDEEAPQVDEHVNRYQAEYQRSDLISAATALGWGYDQSAGKTEVAEWLGTQDPELVEQALEDPESVEAGDEEADESEGPDDEDEGDEGE